MAEITTATTFRNKNAPIPTENERFLRCCADIASALIEDYEASKAPCRSQKDVNLNSLRAKFARKHKIGNMPPLTAIIAAVPEHYKKYILPKLVAKPIREPNRSSA
jgi:elongator complex protein 3